LAILRENGNFPGADTRCLYIMRAALFTRYGPPDVLQVSEVAKPVPKDNEVLVRIRATTVAAADWRIRKADPFVTRFLAGLWRPTKIQTAGMEFSGTVESLGKTVTRFWPGQEVFGGTLFKLGCQAEYVCVAEDAMIAAKPVNMALDESAAVFFGGITVLGFLGNAPIQKGMKVLIYGASGSVGVFAVQLAKHFGAEVTAVCSTANLDMVKSLGADSVVDYTRDDFSQAGRVYDMVFDTVGKSGFWRAMKCLKRGGFYVLVAGIGGNSFILNVLGILLGRLWGSATGRAKVVSMPKRGGIQHLLSLKELIEAGSLRTVIERRYSLAEIAEAHRHAEAGHKKGHVVIVLVPASR